MRPGDAQTTHACGACRARLFTARYRDTGILVHVERNTKAVGDLEVVAELPGVADGQLPHVVRTTQRQTVFREHLCPKVRAHSAAAMARKVRT